jgi:hypothetical protein
MIVMGAKARIVDAVAPPSMATPEFVGDFELVRAIAGVGAKRGEGTPAQAEPGQSRSRSS